MSDQPPKPCPDCGAPAEQLENNLGHYTFCPNDDCRTRPCTKAHPTEAEAIIAWNHDQTH
jgi:hypothetical protein